MKKFEDKEKQKHETFFSKRANWSIKSGAPKLQNSTEMRALIGEREGSQSKRKSKYKMNTEDSDSDCGLEFEDESTNQTEQKTFRDLLALKKVSFTDKFGKPKPGDYDKAG